MFIATAIKLADNENIQNVLLAYCTVPCLFILGFTTVYISDPSAVEKLFRSEGLYPRRNRKVEEMFEHFFKSRPNKSTFAFE